MIPAHQAALNTLRSAGFFIVAWTSDEVANVNAADLSCLEDSLIQRGNDFIAEHQSPEQLHCPYCGRTLEDDEEIDNDFCNSDDCPRHDEPGICTACNGSGEGQHDGTRCSSCKGKGVEQNQNDDFDEPERDPIYA